MADTDFDALIPGHLQDNYRLIVAERHDGDWSKLARQFDASGDDLLARWAASQAPAKSARIVGEHGPELAVDKAPRTTRAKKTA